MENKKKVYIYIYAKKKVCADTSTPRVTDWD